MLDRITRLNAALEGRYRVERPLGEGGMATVYLADDLRHERKVALKVLKPELAAVVGADRFLAEIKTTANLQHPHILPLFDSGEADSFLFYVMPYVEGESLRERLDREHQLPVDEAVKIATNVAEALDYAHSHGVIHRDIKPANILLQAGKPVVSDFGIALALGAAGAGRLTETGLSLGTPHYMSPEQATGDVSVGAATDIYALACVLYEMLVGEPPYTGGTPQAVLGRIVTGDAPSASNERKSVSGNVDAAIRRALEKVPADRFAEAQDFAKALADPAFKHREPIAVAAGLSTGSRFAVGFAAAAAVFGVLAAWGWLRPMPSRVFAEPLQASLLFPTDSGPAAEGLALSPDGTQLAFVTLPNLDGGRIWVRSLENGQQRPLPGTEEASAPVWSPDGSRIAFRIRQATLVVPAAGGPVVTVAEREDGIVGLPNWDLDGDIIFVAGDSIWSVSQGSGAMTPLAQVEESFNAANPLVEALPDGQGFLVGGGGGQGRGSGIYAGDLSTGEFRLLIQGGFQPHYVDGWLVFRGTTGRTVFAQEFDPESRTLRGRPIPLANGIPTPGGHAQFAVSANMFVYASGDEGDRADGTSSDLLWVDEAGSLSQAVPLVLDGWMRDLSPDGSWIASGGWGLWVVNTEGGLPRRIERAGDRAFNPRWSQDGTTISYATTGGLRAITVNPGDSAVLLVPGNVRPVGWGPAGEILFIANSGDGSRELRVRDAVNGETRVVQSGAVDAALSPDGNWLAYVSARGNNNDQPQVFVRAYQGPGPLEVRISTNGGYGPRWGPTGTELYFVTPRGEARVSSLSFDRGVSATTPRTLPVNVPVTLLWVHPDGRVLIDIGGAARGNLMVLRDWQALGDGVS